MSQPINPKQQGSSPKANWQALRQRYTWHLRPPFKSQFNRSHWWKGQSGIEPIAALYELARRHPLVPETPLGGTLFPSNEPRLLLPSSDLSPFLRCTCVFAMKSWRELTESEQNTWKSSIGKVKSFDSRPSGSLGKDVTSLAQTTIYQKRRAALQLWEEIAHEIGGYNDYTGPTDIEWEAAIAQRAVEAHSEGFVLLAIAPDLAPAKAAQILEKLYREHVSLFQPERSRSEDWLRLISEFENAEASPHKAKSQVFVRYRRAVDSIRFT